jgi:hypothetical protein
MMTKRFEGNEDWIKREQGRVPTKGAMAAERASAGLGTSEDEAALSGELPRWLAVPAKPPETSAPPEQRP